MKRSIPLLITFLAGIVLIFSHFIPFSESWGEEVAKWFDILASIAFLLGGGNLLKVHLTKISRQQAGWGYSGIVIVSFIVTLFVGLTKWGAPPATNQEFHGESMVKLAANDLPETLVFEVDGELPIRTDKQPIPASARMQFSHGEGKLKFHGWMSANQRDDLMEYRPVLKWQCAIWKLHELAQPEGNLKGVIAYRADHRALFFKGRMSELQRDELLAMSDRTPWQNAVKSLFELANRSSQIELTTIPDRFSLPESLEPDIQFDPESKTLTVRGPMTGSQRSALANPPGMFETAMPDPQGRAEFLRRLENEGEPLTPEQLKEFHRVLDRTWNVPSLILALENAGLGKEASKSPCEMFEEQQKNAQTIEPKHPKGRDVTLTDTQRQLLRQLALSPKLNLDEVLTYLRTLGEFSPSQESALKEFFNRVPSVGVRNHQLALGLLKVKEGKLTDKQRRFLFADYQFQKRWEQEIGQLYFLSQQTKYSWSGAYNAQGTPFWWIYEYLFKPLTATMFSLLAFYVASASFRAFRAKNLNATLLLGTAFIILLSRTQLGALISNLVPEQLAMFKITNLSIYAMQIFNTAGNRAIMIGIALGIASTSLKVLLGVDRSYLGSQEN